MKLLATLFSTYLYLFCNLTFGQSGEIISRENFQFLQKITQDVLDSARILPGQSLPAPFGKNNTGGTLVRPGGRDTYPSFWIRDYAMSVETGLVKNEEQKHMLLLTASSQCNQTWITKGGSMIPFGAIPDHIRVDDSLPIYFPGTYDYEGQGVKKFGMVPPYDDQFYFIVMAYQYAKSTSDFAFLSKEINGISLIDRLEIAFKVVPSKADNQIVFTNDNFRGVDFGFLDAIEITGELCYASILKYRAAIQMAEIFDQLKNKIKSEQYNQIATKIKKALPSIFLNSNGMLRASTGKSGQSDVWATSFAIYLGLINGEDLIKACQYLSNAYRAGTLAYKGSIRHVLTSEDFNEKTAWESALIEKNTYQNGAYWGTPTGWVVFAIAQVNASLAKQLLSEYISELRENDFRKGLKFKSPVECFAPGDYAQGPVYLTTVSCPYTVVKKYFVKH